MKRMKCLRLNGVSLLMNRLTLKHKLMCIYALAVLVPIALLGFLYLSNIRQTIYENARSNMLSETREVSQELNTAFHSYEMLASVMTGDKELISVLDQRYERLIDAYDVYRMIWKQYQNYLQNWSGLCHVTIYVDNASMVSAPPYLIRADRYLQELEEYPLILAAGSSGHWSGIKTKARNVEYWSPQESARSINTFAYSRLLRNKDNRYAARHIVTVEIYEKVLQGILSGLPENLSGALYSSMGDPIISSSDSREESDLILEKLRGQRIGAVIPWEAQDSLWTAVTLDNGWCLATRGTLRDIMLPVHRLTISALIFLFCSMFASFLMIYLFSNSLHRRTGALVDKMERINRSPEEPISSPAPGGDEIAILDRQFTQTARHLQVTMQQQYALELQKTRYQLDVLLTQISPHFLYNALSTVNWLIDCGDTDKAHLAVESLSRFYQVNLSRGRDIITLEEEQVCLDAYLDIQRLRYPGRIRLFNTIDPVYARVLIPKLTLQILVDNCIQHGMGGEKETISILLSAHGKEDRLVISVQDDGLGISPAQIAAVEAGDPAAAAGSGTGIRNVSQRLKLYFGEEYGVHLSPGHPCGTVAALELPLSPGEHDTL